MDMYIDLYIYAAEVMNDRTSFAAVEENLQANEVKAAFRDMRRARERENSGFPTGYSQSFLCSKIYGRRDFNWTFICCEKKSRG